MYDDVLGTVFKVVIFALMIAVTIWGCYSMWTETSKYFEEGNKKQTVTYNLQSVNVSQGIEGEFRGGFHVMRGYIEDRSYYAAYRILDDGGKVLYKMDCDKTIVYETLQQDEGAYVEVEYTRNSGEVAYRLYIPENTIIDEYDMIPE